MNDQANTFTPVTTILPRRVCTVTVSNFSGITINPQVTIIGQVQPN